MAFIEMCGPTAGYDGGLMACYECGHDPTGENQYILV